jgi:hypothetical protein
LLPTCPARARKLLIAEKATVERVIPFTIRLKRKVVQPVGALSCGIDDGAKDVGSAVVDEHTQEVVLKGTIRLRQDVTRKMTQRAQYRRTRRSRKLRYRQPRFHNRGKRGWLPPTIRQKKDSIVRVVRDVMSLCPISQIIVEQGHFDTGSLATGHQLYGKAYQIPNYEGKSFRAKVLWRDRYTCQHCHSKAHLQAHHIRPHSQGGTDTPNNGITLCQACHDSLYQGAWELKKKPKIFIYPAHVNAGKTSLYQELQNIVGQVNRCFGWMTAYWRTQIGIEKTHFNDAIAMVCRNYLPKQDGKAYLIIPKRKRVWENNPIKTCMEKYGFRHWDIVQSYHRNKGIIIGSVRSLKKSVLTLRTTFDDNFSVSYKQTHLVYRFSALVYILEKLFNRRLRMTELERFELCQDLPKFSCGSLVKSSGNIAQAYVADISRFFLLPAELQQKYDATQRNYAALPPKARAIADILLPWMLGLRLQYGAECTEMMVYCYPRMSAQARTTGLQQLN